MLQVFSFTLIRVLLLFLFGTKSVTNCCFQFPFPVFPLLWHKGKTSVMFYVARTVQWFFSTSVAFLFIRFYIGLASQSVYLIFTRHLGIVVSGVDTSKFILSNSRSTSSTFEFLFRFFSKALSSPFC